MLSAVSRASLAAAIVTTVAWSPVPSTIRADAQPADYFKFPLPSWDPHCLGFGSEWRYCNGTVLRRCTGSGAVWLHTGVDIKTEIQPVMAAANGVIIGYIVDPTFRGGVLIRHQTPDGVVITQYWHVWPRAGYSVGTVVTRGEVFADIADMGSRTHFHFAVFNGEYDSHTWNGALPPARCDGFPAFPYKFVDPTAFVQARLEPAPAKVVHHGGHGLQGVDTGRLTPAPSASLVLAGIATSIAISFNILLPVVPVLVERGGPHGAAGAATAALFIGAVVGELFTPWLMSRWSSSRLLVGGQLMTALPSLVYVVPHASAALMLAAASARGLGMGVAIVVSVVLVGEVAAPERRGRSIGYFGLALSAPGIVVPSIGVWLLEAGHVEVDALVAFVIGAVGALLVLSLPRAAAPMPGASTNLLSAFRRPGLLLIFAGFVMVSSSFGAVITFAPIALPATGIGSVAVFLFVAGAARAASRWVAGVLGDRRQGRLVLAASIGVTFVGLVALASRANPVVVIFAGVAFGAGYGAVQTTAYLAMTARGSSAHRNNVSALWNSGIDLGSSLGGTLLGLAAARFGYATAIWAIPAVVAIALPLFLVPVKPLPEADSSGALIEAATP